MRILHYPCFRSQAELDDAYHRACWYLPDMREHTVVFPFHAPALRPGPPPQGFGAEAAPEFTPEFVVARDNPDVTRLLNSADFLLLWRDDLNRMERYNLQGVSKRVLNVSKDSRDSRHEAYHNAILRHELLPPAERLALVEENRARFLNILPRLRADTAHVFGTGPSLALAMNMDVGSGARIVCNAAVRDRKLLEHVRPTCIAAADPALHYGVSRYAAAFREHLVSAMRNHDAFLFMPMGYYPLFARRHPDLASRAFGVPVTPRRPEEVSVDLAARFQIACYANILTLFLLPLGATLAPEVRVVGCDGRSPLPTPKDDNPSPFWKHHPDSEFEALYPTLKTCHPGFFHLDYDDWYAEHCEGARILVEAVEAKGGRVLAVTPSYIPCLAERLVPEHREPCLNALRDAPPPASPYEWTRDTRTKRAYTASVIVSMYKAERFVAPMLHNLLSQTLYRRGEVEIILIDSNSPTQERDVALPFLETHPHLFYGRTRERETVYGAFNRAIKESRGRYIMNLDTDNRLRLDALEIFAEQLDNRPDVGLVYGNQYIGQFENESFHNHVKFGRCHRPRFSPDMMLHKYYFGSELMWRKQLHDQVGYYDESFVVAGDYEMVCRLASVAGFLHVDRWFGLYQKNLQGVEYTNLELCSQEDQRIRETYAHAFPRAVDPPRVHVHYPVAPDAPNDYLTIVCHCMSFDKPIDRSVGKIFECLEFPFIIYCIDQNSSQATKDSIAHLQGEGLLTSGDALTPRARALFSQRIAYKPTLRFLLLAHGETMLLDKDFLSMNRPRLTAYFKQAHEQLTARFRAPNGWFDPLKTRFFCDHHEFERLDLRPHVAVDDDHLPPVDTRGADVAVCIQHYAPARQEAHCRDALRRAVDSVRDQDFQGRVQVVVTDDGSPWSRELAGDDPSRLIRAHDRTSLGRFPAMADMDVDFHLYKPRTGYFSKGVLWNAALAVTTAPLLVFLDDDHHFLRRDSLRRYAELLRRYELVVGHTRKYAFQDIDGVRHVLELGFNSPVVQGSNFGLRRSLLESIGGFEPRTLLWGTGDDPALFWKLHQRLRPLKPGAPFRACYADAIVTENLHSGRWREDCRVDLELFLTDFLRLHGAHPNDNPSRNRAAWMRHLPDPDTVPDAVQPQPGLKSADPVPEADAPVLTVLTPALDVGFRRLWRCVAALLEQHFPERRRVLVVAGSGLAAADLAWLPRAATVVPAQGTDTAENLRQQLLAVDGPWAGWIDPRHLPAEKLLKGALTALRGRGAGAVCGGHARLDPDGFGLRVRQPPPLETSTMALAAAWAPGQPVFGDPRLLARALDGATGRRQAEDAAPEWSLRALLRLVRRDADAAGDRRAHPDHGHGVEVIQRPLSIVDHDDCVLSHDDAARLLLESATDGQDILDLLAGGVAGLGASRDDEPGRDEEHLRLLPWVHESMRRLDWFFRIFEAVRAMGAARAAVFGDDREAAAMLESFWPAALKPVRVIRESGAKGDVSGVPAGSPEETSGGDVDVVIPASPRFMEPCIRLAAAHGWKTPPLSPR